jgi:A/G-specific adenine glycosylase
MLQQTRVEAVKEYYRRFLTELPTVQTLAEVEEDRLLKLWEGLGYYNRARNLKKAAETITWDLDGQFPDTYEGILALSGIGEYTAGAIGSICFELPTPAVDGNVLRVYTRVMEDDSNIDKASTKKAIREALLEVYPEGKCGMTTQSLMELGATVCLPNGLPKCEECPLNHICQARLHGTWQQFPVRDEKKKRKIVDKTVLVLQVGERVAIRKRPANGLLPNLWEFPNIDEVLTDQEAADYASQWKTEPQLMQMKTTYTHIFSHVEWHMQAYYLTCGHCCENFVWVTKEELAEKYALPSAFRPLQDLLYSSSDSVYRHR